MWHRGHRFGRAIVVAVSMCVSSGTAFATVTANPTSVTCPAALVGSTSAAAPTTLAKSSGSSTITLTLGTCSGSGAGTFNFPATMDLTVNTTLSITYVPSAIGTRSCDIVASNGNGSDATISATGSGFMPPTIAVTTPSAFPAVRVLDSAVAAHTSTRTVTVQNNGGSDLVISNVTLTGDFSIDSSSSNQTTATISAGNAKNWTLQFNPSVAGTRNGTLTFTSNAPTATASVNLTGDGTTGLYTATPANTGNFTTVVAGTTAGLDIAITHTGGTPKGILSFATVTVASASAGWFAISAQPTTLDNGTTTGTVTVTCTPPVPSTATAMGVVTISADADMTAVQTVNVQCTGGSSLLALGVSTVDLDPTLVGMTSQPKTVVLTNNGTSAANVGFTSGSANAGKFTVRGPGGCGVSANNCAVPIGGMITITMTFSPTAERSVSASFGVQGGNGAPPTFIANGRGIDRHIVLPDTLQFEDTFRNPGTDATVAPVMIENTGEYPIVISALTVGGPGSDVWFVADETLAMLPLTVPGLAIGLARVPIQIRFAPREAGKADDGQLLIMNDDGKVSAGMPIVLLSGNGKDRNVDVTPGSVYLGQTFAGISTRLSITRSEQIDHLTIKNNEMPDARNNFLIREIQIQGDDAAMFEIVGLDGNSLDGRMLNAQDELAADVIFKPTYPGDFDASVLVYLDQDTTPQPAVTVRGRALYIDAHGSGGCSAGHGERGGVLVLLGTLGLVLRRRRR